MAACTPRSDGFESFEPVNAGGEKTEQTTNAVAR
jgi:hypothetical protein